MARWQFALFGLTFPVLIAGILFSAAGRWDVPMFWFYVGLWLTLGVIMTCTADLDLARERWRPGGESKDSLVALRLLGMLCMGGQWVVAGLDVGRYHWSDTVPIGVQALGLAGFTAGLAVVRWSQSVNRFFSSAIRIQRDRGQHVVTSGPYRYVRHPGYAAFILGWICSALILGSWGSLLPSLAFSALLVRRTAVEDRFLQAELEGYAQYARKVRYRLVPGLW
jgi:protein-S-isoprenylcysteine O-methyltransferase Ste14